MKNIFKNLLALYLGIIVSLLLLEIGLRLYNPFETRVKGDRIILPASRQYIFTNKTVSGIDSNIVHTKNKLGFRGPGIPSKGLDNYLSIISVGGSTTECFYLSDGKDWPAVLQDLLKNSFHNVWINNAGLDGHSTFGHSVLLNDHLSSIRPKVILFLIGTNDVGKEGFSGHVLSHVRDGLRFNSLEVFMKSVSAYSEAASLALNTYRYIKARFYGLPHRNIDIKKLDKITYSEEELEKKTQLHHQKYLPSYRARLMQLVADSRKMNAEPIFVTQPVLFGPSVDPITGVDLGHIDVNGESGRAAWQILQEYNMVLKEVGMEEDVLVIDLAGELERRSDYYDFTHYTNKGSEEVARILYQHLKPHFDQHYSEFSKTENRDRSR